MPVCAVGGVQRLSVGAVGGGAPRATESLQRRCFTGQAQLGAPRAMRTLTSSDIPSARSSECPSCNGDLLVPLARWRHRWGAQLMVSYRVDGKCAVEGRFEAQNRALAINSRVFSSTQRPTHPWADASGGYRSSVAARQVPPDDSCQEPTRGYRQIPSAGYSPADTEKATFRWLFVGGTGFEPVTSSV